MWGEPTWQRACRDWWSAVESPRGRVVELTATLILSILAVNLYPDNASNLQQVGIQGGVIVSGLVILGVGALAGIWAVQTPRQLLAEAYVREDQRGLIRPLRIDSVDPDDDWRRLVIKNDNDFAVGRAYVRIVRSEPEGLVSRGLVLCWSTKEVDISTRYLNIAANGGERVLDLFCWNGAVDESSKLTFYQPVPNTNKVEPIISMPVGKLSLWISLESEDAVIPRAEYRLEITNWGDKGGPDVKFE